MCSNGRHWKVQQENLLVKKHHCRVYTQLWHQRGVGHRENTEGAEASHPVSVTTGNLVQTA